MFLEDEDWNDELEGQDLCKIVTNSQQAAGDINVKVKALSCPINDVAEGSAQCSEREEGGEGERRWTEKSLFSNLLHAAEKLGISFRFLVGWY